MLFTIIIFIETACLVFALKYISKAKAWWRLFIPFLLLTVAVEITGYVLYFLNGISNHGMFNIYLPLEIGFLFFVLYHLCKPFFKVGWWLMAAYLVFAGIYIWESSSGHWKEYSAMANTFASFIIIVTAVLFYYFLMKQEGNVELTRYPAFWIMSGLFVFYLGALGCNLFTSQLMEIYEQTKVPVRYIIMLILNFILYCSWSYAFICQYRRQISFSLL